MDFSSVGYYDITRCTRENGRHTERRLGHVVVVGNIDDKLRKYGWDSCKLQVTITKWLFRRDARNYTSSKYSRQVRGIKNTGVISRGKRTHIRLSRTHVQQRTFKFLNMERYSRECHIHNDIKTFEKRNDNKSVKFLLNISDRPNGQDAIFSPSPSLRRENKIKVES